MPDIRKKIRLIARLDVKGPHLIKSVNLEGLRVIGSPNQFAFDYYNQGIDELIYMDCVASLYGRNNLKEVVNQTAHNIFVPITVGGGIRSLDDVMDLLSNGADKVAINTAAVANPLLITDIAHQFGSQCIVASIEAKKTAENKWEALIDNGRERTGLDVIAWVQELEALGAGEILLTSIDREGTRKGFDIELLKAVTDVVAIPVIASGGMGAVEHLIDAVEIGGVDAIAMADSLHYRRMTVQDIRSAVREKNIEVRHYEFA